MDQKELLMHTRCSEEEHQSSLEWKRNWRDALHRCSTIKIVRSIGDLSHKSMTKKYFSPLTKRKKTSFSNFSLNLFNSFSLSMNKSCSAKRMSIIQARKLKIPRALKDRFLLIIDLQLMFDLEDR